MMIVVVVVLLLLLLLLLLMVVVVVVVVVVMLLYWRNVLDRYDEDERYPFYLALAWVVAYWMWTMMQ